MIFADFKNICPNNIKKICTDGEKKIDIHLFKSIAFPQQMSLFSDFNGIEFEQLIEFYQHEQHWSNRMILGDSLMVMTSLAEKEGLKGQVQTIYIDPPYGIKFGTLLTSHALGI